MTKGQRELAKTARILDQVADLIASLDSDLFHALAENDCDVVMPQQLRQMAGRLDALTDDNNGYSSRIMAKDDNPGKATWTANGKTWIP